MFTAVLVTSGITSAWQLVERNGRMQYLISRSSSGSSGGGGGGIDREQNKSGCIVSWGFLYNPATSRGGGDRSYQGGTSE